MLDQNTDRMWYVIGALVVGAAIIFIANGTLPDLFASVGNSMQSVVEQTEFIGRRKYLSNDDLTPHGQIKDLSTGYRSWEYTALLGQPVMMVDGFKHVEDVMEIPYGYTGELGYEVWIPEEFENIKGAVDINVYPIEGVSWSGNDNDYASKRTVNGNGVITSGVSQGKIPLEAGTWNTIVLTFENTSPSNKDETPLFSRSCFGIYRPESSVNEYAEVPVKIRNVYVDIYER